MFKKISGKVEKDSGECWKRFRGIFKKIPGNVEKDSGECLKRFRRILSKIPGNVVKDSGQCSRINRGYSIFFLMGIFLNHLWLILNILKWQNCKIFTKLVPSQTLLRSSHQKCSVKKGVFKNLRKLTGKQYWSLFLIKLLVFRPATLLNSDSHRDVFL